MLRGLIKRKRKYENYRKQTIRWQAAALICAASFCLFLAAKGLGQNGFLSEVLNDSIYLFWIMSAAFAYSTAYYFKKKEDKAEGEFHKLRCEIIQKSTDLWPQPDMWKSRETVFKIMKQEYDINLYFESK
ncbi:MULTISPECIES: YpbF family protein [Bacillus]|nr:YpbF family protein [Bacillus sp. NSP9.1]